MSSLIKLTPEKQDFLKKNLESGMAVTAISRAYQRKFGAPIRPQDIENWRASIFTPTAIKAAKEVTDIRSKLGSHDRQLEFARALIEERMNDPEVSNNELVNLAREYRTNITASQQLASMTSSNADVQFVLMYNDVVQSASQRADIQDAEFTVEEGDYDQ